MLLANVSQLQILKYSFSYYPIMNSNSKYPCFRIFRKGQAAVEYLIIISIVLVVALLAANSALNISGSIGSLAAPKTSQYWQQAQISILAQTIYSDGSASFLVKNRKPFGIKIDTVAIGENTVALVGFTLAPGEEKILPVPRSSKTSGKTGDAYSYLVGFNYADMSDSSAKYGFFPAFPVNGKFQ